MSERARRPGLSTAPSAATFAIDLSDVWLNFHLNFYKRRVTLRGAALSGLTSLIAGRRRSAGHQVFWALRGINLRIDHGESVGIIGPNGAGKSTLLRAMAGIYTPDKGVVRTDGNISTLLSLSAGFDLRRPGRENIFKNGILLGMTRSQIEERVDAIVEMADLGQFIDAPVATYSAGMRTRLGFSVAASVDPDIMLIDEVVNAGDARFRKRVGSIFDQLAGRQGTVVFVTHSTNLVKEYCSRAVWLEEGVIRMDGPAGEIVDAYLGELNGERRR